MSALGSFLLPAVTVLCLSPAVARLARRWGVVDRPGAAAHKGHRRPVPLLGGVPVALAVLLGWGLEGRPAADALGLALAALLGLWDDLRPAGLPPAAKLMGQAVVAGAWWACGGGSLLGAVSLVAAMNVWNLLDHADGVCPAVAAAAALGLVRDGQGAAWPVALACLTFLWFNRPPARLFLGDLGSHAVGFALGALALRAGTPGALSAAAFLGAMAVPALDTGWVVLRRLATGQAPWRGDRAHLTHVLARALGLGERRSVLLLAGLQWAAALLCLGPAPVVPGSGAG